MSEYTEEEMRDMLLGWRAPDAGSAGATGAGLHPAFKRTWWVNLYPDGQFTGTLCESRESALDRCTYTGETPDAAQQEVRIVPARGDKYAEQLQQIADALGMTYARGSALVERVRELIREQKT